MLNFKYVVHVLVLYSNVEQKTLADSSLMDTAAFIANTAYKHYHVTSVVWFHTDLEYVTAFLNQFHGSLVIAPIQNNNKFTVSDLNKAVGYKQTVLLAESSEEFANFLKLVKLELVIPIRLLLVLTKQVSDLSAIPRIAWNNDIADILILIKSNDGDVSLYSYFPYNHGVCGDLTLVKLKIEPANLFPKKFTNFRGCPIRATLVHLPPYLKLEIENDNVTSISGVDGNVLMLIIERLNASLNVFSSTDHGEFGDYINGTGTGSFGDLLNRHADILAPAAVLNSKRYSVLQVSHAYKTTDVYWCGPNPREINTWAKVLLHFFSSSTLFICLTFAVFVTIIALFKRASLHKIVTKDSVFFQAFIIFLGQSVKFETKSVIINSLFLLWIWSCLIVRIEYQGDLVEGLRKKILESRFGSVEEAINNVEGHGGVQVFRDYYRGTTIEKNFTVLHLNEISSYIRYISDGKRFLLVTDIMLVHQLHRKVQILQEPVTHAATCFCMRPGWPAAKEVDKMIQQVNEAGFVQKIWHDHWFEWMLTQTPDPNDSRETKPLDMPTLSACFYGLIVLWVKCFIIFIFEIIHYRLKTRRIKIN